MPAVSSIVVGDAAVTIGCAEILLAEGHTVPGVVTGDLRVASWCAARQLRASLRGPG